MPAQGLGLSPVKCPSVHYLYRLLDQAPLKDLPSVFVDHRLLQHMPGNCRKTTPQRFCKCTAKRGESA